jgi:hypothetical protein
MRTVIILVSLCAIAALPHNALAAKKKTAEPNVLGAVPTARRLEEACVSGPNIRAKIARDASELVEAVGDANVPMILLPPGVYKLDSKLMIRRPLVIMAEKPGTAILDGNENHQVLNINLPSSDDGTAKGLVKLDGIHIRNGKSYSGGGVYIVNGNVNFNNCHIYNNIADFAGGVLIDSGNVNFNNCQIYNNVADYNYGSNGSHGGGVYVANGQVTFTSSNIYGNTAKDGAGGGVYNRAGTVNFQDCNIYSNTVTQGHGGGVYISGGQVTFTSTNIYDNTSGSSSGGGVYAKSNGEVRALNVQLWGNSPDTIKSFGTITNIVPETTFVTM